MYTLYFKRSEREIKVTRARKTFQKLNFTDEVVRYNDCYYMCAQRKPLIDKASEIKYEWIKELEADLRDIIEIKI